MALAASPPFRRLAFSQTTVLTQRVRTVCPPQHRRGG
uniref:Uncharacterized protein n=1 Tax=Anopheles christyi TaxID=43041 RepID=A0A182KAF8_9DIPT